MEHNREQAINELDTQLEFAKFTKNNGVLISAKCAQFVLNHIQFYEQKIKELTEGNFKLENRLKECENGYEETLHLERCKLHDAEEKVTKLTEENERLRGIGLDDNQIYIRLSDAKHAIMNYIGEQTVSKYASSDIGKAVRDGAEGAFNELDYIIPAQVAPKADTVRKMQEIIATKYAVSKVHYANDKEPTITYELTNWQLDQIEKEMLEE